MTSSLTPGQSRSTSSMAVAASTTCSKLSSMSTRLCSRTCSTRVSSGDRPAASYAPSARAIVGSTIAESEIAARSTKTTRSTGTSTTSVSACEPSRVFPLPPGPVSVTSRMSSRLSSARSESGSGPRPMNGVGWRARLAKPASNVLAVRVSFASVRWARHRIPVRGRMVAVHRHPVKPRYRGAPLRGRPLRPPQRLRCL